MEVIFEIFFLTLSNVDIQFAKKEIIWRFYIGAKALPNTKQIKLINKKKFAKIMLDENFQAFVIHVTFLNLSLILIYLARKA